MKATSKLRTALSIFYGFAIVLVVQAIAYSYFLKPAWDIMEDQGILRAERGGTVASVMFVVTIVLAVWILAELWKKADDTVEAVYFGFLMGIALSLCGVSSYFLYQFQWEVPVVMLASNIIGYSLAGLAYGLSMKGQK